MNKEFRCTACGRDFEGLLPICPACGKLGQRAFRTAPGIGNGRVRKDEAFLAEEFKRRGITNYTNAGGVPRGTFGGVTAQVHEGGVYQYGDVMAGTADPRGWQRSGVARALATKAGGEVPLAMPAFNSGKSVGGERIAPAYRIPTEVVGREARKL